MRSPIDNDVTRAIATVALIFAWAYIVSWAVE